MGAEAVAEAATGEGEVSLPAEKVSPSHFVVAISMETESLEVTTISSSLLLWGLTTETIRRPCMSG